MSMSTKVGNRIGEELAGKIGSDISENAQDGETLSNDVGAAIAGGVVTGALAKVVGAPFGATVVSSIINNMNTVVNNHEDPLLNKLGCSDTTKSAVKTFSGSTQLVGEVVSTLGNTISGAIEGSLTSIENMKGYQNDGVKNAARFLESIKTGNVVVDGVASVAVNTATIFDRISSGMTNGFIQSCDNMKNYAGKASNNANVLLSDVANRIASSFYSSRSDNNSNISLQNISTVTSMFAHTFPSMQSSVCNNLGTMIQSRYGAMIQNYVQQENAKSMQIARVFQQQSAATTQNVARNIYLNNLRQTTSWATHTYYQTNIQPSTVTIETDLRSGTPISIVAARYGISSGIVETVARSMNGVVFGGCYYNVPYYVGSFGSLLTLTGLHSSYNCMHSYGFGSLLPGLGWTGGVENSVGKIPNLNPYNKTIFAIKSDFLPFSDNELNELLFSLLEGIYDYDSFPFYSLHFNNQGYMYPVMHEVYRGTIVGKVIEYLDYIMKGFLNGDIYKDGYAESWHLNQIFDSQILKSNLLKIKDIYKKCGKKYYSLREMMTLYDLEPTPGVIHSANTVKGTDLKTSFRIIAYQKNIQQHEELFLMDPSFKVEYTIDKPPSYDEYLEDYRKKTGKYPKDFRNLNIVYTMFCETIKDMLLLLPQASKYFKMLGVINFFCYWFETVRSMGYKPDFGDFKNNYTRQINALPPIPIRYYEKHQLSITNHEMFDIVMQPSINKKLTDYLLDIGEMPTIEIVSALDTFFAKKLVTKTSDPHVCEDVLEQVADSISKILKKEVTDTINKFYEEYKIENIDADPISTLKNCIKMILKKADDEKEHMKDRIDEMYKVRDMLKDQENTKRQKLNEFIAEQLKPLTAAQISQNAANIEDFKQKNMQQCEKEIQETRIKFGYLMLFGEDSLTVENSAVIANDPEKTKLVNDFLKELIDDIPLETRLTESYALVDKSAQMAIDAIEEVINSLHTIIKSLYDLTIEHAESVIIKYNYLHSVVEIGDPTLLNSKGQKYSIVGGCGMRMKNMEAIHIPNGKGLYEEIKKHKLKDRSFIKVRYLDEDYYVFSMNASIHTSKDNEITKVDEINEITNMTKADKIVDMHQIAVKNDINYQHMNLHVFNRYGMLLIHEAAYNGYVNVVANMLKYDPSLLNIKTEAGYTCLMISAEQGKLECVKLLLNAGADIDTVLCNGLFPLLVTIQNGFSDVALTLLDSPKIGNINRTVDSHMTCLHMAVELNLINVVRKLLKMGADTTIRRKKDSFTSFHCAVSNGNCEMINILINDQHIHSLTPLYDDPTLAGVGRSALHLTIAGGHIDAVKLLISHPLCLFNCKDLNGNTPLMFAIESGYEAIAKLLVAKSIGCIDYVNSSNDTALLLAGKKNMLTIGDMILNISPTQLNYKNGDISYHYYLLVNGAYAKIHKLISDGKFDHKIMFESQSCLDIVMECGHNLCTDYFLELGLQPKSTKYAILWAIRADNVSYVKEYLMIKKQFLKKENIIRELVKIATEFGSIMSLKLLLSYISDDDIVGNMSLTPHLLISAMNSGSIECFNLVLKRCTFSKMNEPVDNEGNTLAHYAVKTGNMNMIKSLYFAGYSFTKSNNHDINAFQSGYHKLMKFKIFNSPEFEEHLIDIAVRSNDTKSIRNIKSISSIIKTAIKYNQIYIIKWLQERDMFLKEYKHFQSTNAIIINNLYMIDAVNEDWKQLNEKMKKLRKNLSNGRIDNDWPLHVPIDGEPILHILFSQAVIPDKNALKKFNTSTNNNNITDIFMKDSHGFPLIFKLLKGSVMKDNTLFKQKIMMLQKYFPNKFNALLTQTNDDGIDVFSLLDKKKLDIVKELNVDSIDLLQAVCTEQLDKVKELLKKGSNPYVSDQDMNTPLHIAIRNKNIALALLLIQYMNRFELYNNLGLTPFILASTVGVIEIMMALKNKCNIYATCSSGLSALHYAAMKNDINAVTRLLAMNLPIDIGSRPIDNDDDDDNSSHDSDITPLYMAIECGQLEMYNFLRLNDANINVVTNNGKTIADAMIISKNPFLAEELRTLPHFDVEIEQNKMLWIAAKVDNVFVLRMLYLDEVQMDVCDNHGYNALDYACINMSKQAVKFLIECGLNVTIDKKLIKDQTVLYYLDNPLEIQPLLPQKKQYSKTNLKTVEATSVNHSSSYLTYEERQLLINVTGDAKLESLACRIKNEMGIRIFRKLLSIGKF